MKVYLLRSCSGQFSSILEIMARIQLPKGIRSSQSQTAPPSNPTQTHEETLAILSRGYIQSGVTLSDP